MHNEHIILGKFSQVELDRIMYESSRIMDTGKRIGFISGQFLGIEYGEATLTGDRDIPEVLVINLQKVDCFTFLDYVEAIRISKSFEEFKHNLQKVRYKSGVISFNTRNHFFADWTTSNSDIVGDITEKIGEGRAIRVQKMLNKKEDGTEFVSGIGPSLREITYIPSGSVDNHTLERLRTGDYIGIYSHMEGLDVSHVGIIIKDAETVYLRHGSSQKEFRKVVNQDFKIYIADKPGIIVLRCKD